MGGSPVGFELRGEVTPARELVLETWRSRGLLAMLARKDFFVRYRRASFGVLWAVGLPLAQALIVGTVFSRFVPFDLGYSYTVFVFTGLTVWMFFNASVTAASTSIVDGSGLSTKIYFPRALFPLVSVATNAYGFLFSLPILILLCLVKDVALDLRVALLVPAIVLMVSLAASLSLVLSALHVYFRDVRYITQAALMAWLYATPILYPLDAIGDLAPIVRANPATGMIELFRASLTGADPGWLPSLWWSIAWTVALFALGVGLHRRFDRVFVDLL